jgi:diguanylate cyclase (GGDEF)-like protein
MNRVRSNAIWAVAAVLLALPMSVPGQQYAFRAYRQAEGLKNLSINAMAVDREGFVWLATENGVFRFLGAGFARYGPEQGIAGIDIHDVYADPGGMVWAGTDQGLFHWDGQRFVEATPQGIGITTLRSLAAESATALLVVDKGRLYRLEHDARGKTLSYRPVLAEAVVEANPELKQTFSVSVVDDPARGREIWAGCGRKLYSWPDDGHTEPYPDAVKAWGAGEGVSADQWQTVLADRTGTLWAAGQRSIEVMARGAEKFEDRSVPGSAMESFFGHAAMIEDPEGRILAPAEGGIARWDGTAWHLIGRANGLEYEGYVLGMAFDAAGDLWLASRGDGLYHWNGYADWEGWGLDQGFPAPFVWGVQQSSAAGVTVATAKGPAWIDLHSGQVRPLFKTPRRSFNSQTPLGLNGDGSLFAVTLDGALFRIEAKTGEAERTGTLRALANDVIQDAAGNRLLTTEQGAFLMDARKPRSQPKRIAAVDALLGGSRRIETGCAGADGTDWLLAGNRLLRFRDGQWTEPAIDGLQKLNGSLLAVSCAGDGTVWATGEQAGVWKLTEQGGRLRASQLELPGSLQSLAYLAILVDRRGWVWLGSDAGLAVWNGQQWRHLTEESGLIWNDISQGMLVEGPDGSLWIGTSGGLAHLLHPEHVFDDVPLAVSVTGMLRGNQAYDTGQRLTLAWAATPLRIELSSATMRNRSELTFQYRMDGLQTEWVESMDGLAVYSALPPGEYVFEARVRNRGLRTTSAPVKVAVRILAPWWRTNWFYGLCVMALAMLVVAGEGLRVRHLQNRRTELEELVRQRTAEVEASREQLRIQAAHDGLTGMLNRTAVLRALRAEMERCRRERTTLMVALVDLDHFKQVNDAHGHLAGDEALRWFAAAVASAIRVYDHAGRYGGEEFLLVLAQIPPEATEHRLNRLHASISNLKISAGETAFVLNCSIGATVFDPEGAQGSVESLLSVADQALYEAKAAGRNRVIFRAANYREGENPNRAVEVPPED